MAKKTSRNIIKELKEKELIETKENITFRLNAQITNLFRKKCIAEDVTMASVIELMMKDFVEN